MLELKGTVILDENSESLLKAEYREQIINEIAEKGNYSEEIMKYLNKCELSDYFRIIERTIGEKIKGVDMDNLRFDEPRILRKLKTIKEIISM